MPGLRLAPGRSARNSAEILQTIGICTVPDNITVYRLVSFTLGSTLKYSLSARFLFAGQRDSDFLYSHSNDLYFLSFSLFGVLVHYLVL